MGPAIKSIWNDWQHASKQVNCIALDNKFKSYLLEKKGADITFERNFDPSFTYQKRLSRSRGDHRPRRDSAAV